MINLREKEIIITENLKKYLGCEVIRTNQIAPTPKYPYVSYTIITPMVANNGTWSEFDDGIHRKEIQQIWSFTVQSQDDMESKTLAFKAYDYLDHDGVVVLNDNGIVVQRIENITNRDNLLTIDYEYRNGFDVKFAFMNEIADETEERIDDITINCNIN